MDNKVKETKQILEEQISKLQTKDFSFLFFVIDTKGIANGSLEYIYNTAYQLTQLGYKVNMLYQEEIDKDTNMDDFVGVGEWMGEKYSNLPHTNVIRGLNTNVSDFLIIPESFSEVMKQTKVSKMPCKRIVLSQQYNLIPEFIPTGMSWGDYGILDIITTSNKQANMLQEIFPFTNISVVRPMIAPCFRPNVSERDLTITLLTRDIPSINKIVKLFILKYPQYRWLTFEDVRGLTIEEVSDKICSSAISVWVDDETSFGYSLLEAVKSDNVIVGKIPEEVPDWLLNEDGEIKKVALWGYTINEVHKLLASAIECWLEDRDIADVAEARKEFFDKFTKEEFIESIEKVYGLYVNNRIEELENIIEKI